MSEQTVQLPINKTLISCLSINDQLRGGIECHDSVSDTANPHNRLLDPEGLSPMHAGLYK